MAGALSGRRSAVEVDGMTHRLEEFADWLGDQTVRVKPYALRLVATGIGVIILLVVGALSALGRWIYILLAFLIRAAWMVIRAAVVLVLAFLEGATADQPREYWPDSGRPKIRPETRQAVYARDGGRCVFCGSRDELQYDHIVPYAQGGNESPANLQLLCRRCNEAKADAF